MPVSKPKERRSSDGDLNCVLLGASGFLGSCVGDELAQRSISFIGTCRQSDSAVSQGYIRFNFPHDTFEAVSRATRADHAIICARLAEPSFCDERIFIAKFDELLASIQSGMRNAAVSKIIYVSSDAVFSGKKGLYIETDIPEPATPYGRRQFLAEKAVQRLHTPYLIVRPSYIFDAGAPRRDKRLSRLEATIRAGDPVKAYSNVFKSPVNVWNLARLIVDNMLSTRTGILHAAASRKSIYEFFSDSLTTLGLQDKSGLVISELNAEPGDTSLSSQFEEYRQ